jgi:hypothetical protein
MNARTQQDDLLPFERRFITAISLEQCCARLERIGQQPGFKAWLVEQDGEWARVVVSRVPRSDLSFSLGMRLNEATVLMRRQPDNRTAVLVQAQIVAAGVVMVALVMFLITNLLTTFALIFLTVAGAGREVLLVAMLLLLVLPVPFWVRNFRRGNRLLQSVIESTLWYEEYDGTLCEMDL